MPTRRLPWPVLGLLIVTALAAAMRFWQLGDLPPGLYHDEAYYGLDALSLMRGDMHPRFYEGWELYANDAHADHPATPTRFPVFFEGNYGREPLHVYLMAFSIALFGNTPFAVRAVSAASGTLAVITIWLAARALFPPDEKHPFIGECRPLLAAFSLGVLFPALHFSRFGIRAMTMLPVTTLAVYAFWRGWRGRNTAWLALAGFFVGLSLYTFAAARLFPLVFVMFGITLLLTDRVALWERRRGLTLATVTAVATAAPLLVFFARYPYFFLFRMSYVANRGKGVVEGSPGLTWFLNIGRVIGGLFWLGETHLRHNLPGRPYFDPVQTVLFLAGTVRGLRFWRRPEYAFVLIWFGIMLLPSILSGDAPHFGRLIGAAPAAAILIAVGGSWLMEQAASLSGAAWVVPVLVALITIPSLALTTRDYFFRYASHPDLARDFYQSDWNLGRYAAGQPAEASLYLSPTQEEMATIYFAVGNPERVQSFNGREGIIPAGIPGRPIVYLIRPEDKATLANLQAYFPEGEVMTAGEGFIPFHVPAGAGRTLVEMNAEHIFDGLIRLLGYSVVREETAVTVTLAWQALKSPPLDFTVFVHLIDSDGKLVAQTDRPPAGYPTSDWLPGEVVSDTYRLELPSDLPPGVYRLQTGFYDPASVTRLGEAAGIGTVTIP